ncbi:MAG: DUF2393 domain-containing protein [Epsilonproteobacteria bacterium]|nr:DUF2393 domain-containing protein [Campylobacterota bacterium]
MVSYFTIVHIITLAIFFVLFIILLILSLKETRKKVLVAMIFSNFLVISMLAVFSMFVLDKYTKKARLEDVSQARVLISESFVVTGRVRNIGRFDISKCFLKVKLVNNAITSKNLKGSNIYNPTGGLAFLTKTTNQERKSTIIKNFLIAKNLRVDELRNFSASMRYPSYFKSPSLIYKLHCR